MGLHNSCGDGRVAICRIENVNQRCTAGILLYEPPQVGNILSQGSKIEKVCDAVNELKFTGDRPDRDFPAIRG